MRDWRPWTPWLYIVRDLGFPIAVAWFVLWRLDASLHELTRQVMLLTIEVAKVGARLAALKFL